MGKVGAQGCEYGHTHGEMVIRGFDSMDVFAGVRDLKLPTKR